MNRKRRELHNLEREVDISKIKLELSLEDIRKQKENQEKQAQLEEEQKIAIEYYEAKIKEIGLLDKNLIGKYSKQMEKQKKLEREIAVYSRNYKQKEQIGAKEADAIENHNEDMNSQIKISSMIIEEQQKEIELLMRIEMEF